MTIERFQPPTYLFAAMLLMALLHYLVPLGIFVVYPYNLLGLVPLGVGVVLNLLADAAFKRVGTVVKSFAEPSFLVTDGVFHQSRHPMYLGMVLMLLGIAILMGSLSPLPVVVMFAVAMELIFIRAEERMLERRFGDHWRTYTKQVRRWI